MAVINQVQNKITKIFCCAFIFFRHITYFYVVSYNYLFFTTETVIFCNHFDVLTFFTEIQ